MRRTLATAGALALAGLLLAGCATGPAGTGDGGATTPATSGDSGPAGSSGDASGEVTIPDTFPVDDIPLIDDDPVFAIDLGTGWTVILPSDDPFADFQVVEEQLTGAGFEETANGTGDGGFGQFVDDAYTINVAAADNAEYGESVAYTVVKNG